MDHLSRLVHPIRRRDKLETDQIDRVSFRCQGWRHHDQRSTLRLARCVRPAARLRLLPCPSPRRLSGRLKREIARGCHYVVRPVDSSREERGREGQPSNGSLRTNDHSESGNISHRRLATDGQERSRETGRYGCRQDCWNGHPRRSNEDHAGKPRTWSSSFNLSARLVALIPCILLFSSLNLAGSLSPSAWMTGRVQTLVRSFQAECSSKHSSDCSFVMSWLTWVDLLN